MNEYSEPDVIEKKEAKPLLLEPDGEVLDWDAYSPPPPPKNPRKIRVQLRYKGRAKPMPHPHPDED